MKKMVLFVVAGLALVAISATATYFVLAPKLGSGASNGQVKAVDATPIPSYDVGPIYTMQTRVVNLGDPGANRYLKIQIVLEFQPGVDKQSDVTTKLSQREIALQDIITTVLSTKTTSQLLTAAGKDELKQELMQQFQPMLADLHLRDILFPEFVMQ